MSEITAIYMSPDRSKVAIVVDDGERTIELFDVELEGTESIATPDDDFAPIWPAP